MFPFLSVLCAVIGILMLFLIVIISTRVWDLSHGPQGSREPQPDAPPPEGTLIEEATFKSLNEHLRRVNEMLASRRRECVDLEKQLELLDGQIESLKDEQSKDNALRGEKGRVPGAPKQVCVIPEKGFEVTRRPVFVEVSAEGFLVHPQKTRYPATEVGRPDSALENFLRQMDQRRREQYLLLLIHPNGTAPFRKLSQHLVKEYPDELAQIQGTNWSRIAIGVEPFSQDWLLIISELSSAE